MTIEPRSVVYMGSCKKDLAKMPDEVKQSFLFGFDQAQIGEKHVNAKPFKGFGSNHLLEIVEDDRGGTYRAVYTIKFKKAVYIIHVFQKKSKKGISTPKLEMDLIEKRLKDAAIHYKANF